jgi:hypothetical protein
MTRTSVFALSLFVLPALSSSRADERSYRNDVEDQSVSAYIRELSKIKPPSLKAADPTQRATILPGRMLATAAAATTGSVPRRDEVQDMAADGYEDR